MPKRHNGSPIRLPRSLTATRRTFLKVGVSRLCQGCPQGSAVKPRTRAPLRRLLKIGNSILDLPSEVRTFCESHPDLAGFSAISCGSQLNWLEWLSLTASTPGD